MAPIIAATGVTSFRGTFSWPATLLALLVSLALQIGVNYANDYSDGVRGTDDQRVGPQRLVGSQAATPAAVKRAAFACFAFACSAGMVITIATGQWWMILVGLACVLAAWYYTGGKHPYGYAGLGELFVFVFFGLVAVSGTVLINAWFPPVRTGWSMPPETWAIATTVGLLSCAVLVINNLRDVATDRAAGKLTLAVRLGAPTTTWLFLIMIAGAGVALVVASALTSAWGLLGLAYLIFAVPACRSAITGKKLLAALPATGLANLTAAAGFTLGLLLASLGR